MLKLKIDVLFNFRYQYNLRYSVRFLPDYNFTNSTKNMKLIEIRENIGSEYNNYLENNSHSNIHQIHIKAEAVTAETDLNSDEYASIGNSVYCRLCANYTESAVDIFDNEVADKSLNMNLYEKLVTYFPIIISKAIIYYLFLLFLYHHCIKISTEKNIIFSF